MSLSTLAPSPKAIAKTMKVIPTGSRLFSPNPACPFLLIFIIKTPPFNVLCF